MKEGTFFMVDEILAEYTNWLESNGFLKSENATSKTLDEFLKFKGLI